MLIERDYFKNIFNTFREAILILDENMRVLSANRSFFTIFKVDSSNTIGALLYDLGNGQWNVPALRMLLEDILPKKTTVDNFTIEHHFESIGQKTMLLNVSKIRDGKNDQPIILLAIEDITERKRAEEDGSESEERFRTLANNISQLAWMADTHGSIFWYNQRWFDYTGTKIEEMRGWGWQKVHHPDHVQRVVDKIKHCFETGKEWEDTFPLRGRDGHYRWFLSRAIPIRDKHGTVARWFGTNTDITESKEIEAGLEKTRKELEVTKIAEDGAREYAESITDTVREPLIVLDQDLRVVTASRSFYEFFKVKPEETMGQLIYDLGNKQWDIPKLRELLETILPQKATFDNYEVEHDFTIIGRRIMLLNARQIKRGMGKERIILMAIEDITERKRLEGMLTESERKRHAEELSKSEEYTRDILQAVDEGFIVIDLEYRVLAANRAYINLIDKPLEDVIGKHCYEFTHHVDKPCWEDGTTVCPVTLTFKTGEHYTSIHRHYDNTGAPVYLEVKSYPLKDKSGKIVSAIEIINDVTEKKKLEDQLRHAQKMEAIGTLAGGIAHDFNNILNVILGFGTMVMDRIGDDPLSKEQMNEVLAAGQRAANLTKRLLLFSRKEVAEFKSTDVKEIVLNMEKMLARIIGEDIKLVAELMGTKAMVMADAGQMEQVLLNLATNARDAMPEGGSLTIKTELREIDHEFIDAYSYGTPGTYAVISVTDTGAGIDKETKDRIFDPFFTTKKVGKGTGLGLSIVYGILKEHNGFIKVYSEPGKGTTFKIWLPVIEDTAKIKPETEALPAVKGGTETILVAEDDASLRKLTRIVLESSGYTVISAEDGEDAITKFMENREKIQLVVLDMIMPNKSGKEVCEEIRKMHPASRILFLSGYTMDIMKTQEIIAEGFDFLLKPVSPKDFLKKVREILDK